MRILIVTDAWAPLMDTMITFYRPVEGWFHQTLRGEVVIGVVDNDEPQGLEHGASDAHLLRIGRYVLPKAPRLGELRAVRQWGGVYDMTPDRKPMLGPVTQLQGFVQANGDNGRGIDEEVIRTGRDGHWGLSGMRERAQRIGAHFKVWSRTGAGTEIELTVPNQVAFQMTPKNRETGEASASRAETFTERQSAEPSRRS